MLTGEDTLFDNLYSTYIDTWLQLRDTYRGEKYVKERGTTYLPQLTDQTTTEFEAYRDRAYFFNMVKRTTNSLVGMINRKPPSIKPEQASEILSDEPIDMRGNKLHKFVGHTVRESLLMGRSLILVDYDDKAYLSLYKTEDIWKIKRDRLGEIQQVLLYEEHPDEDSDDIPEHRLRELVLEDGVYKQYLYNLSSGDERIESVLEEVTPLKNGQTFDYIPAYEINMSWDELGDSLMQPLSDLNLAHYRQVADYKHLLHYCAIPTLLLTGVPNIVDESGNTSPPEIRIGAENAIVLQNAEANGKWIVAGADAANPIRNELNDLEARMALASASVAVSSVSRETASANSQRNSANTASVVSLVREINQVMTSALQEYIEWQYGSMEDLKFTSPLEFTAQPLDAATILALVSQYNAGLLSIESFLDMLERGELMGETTPQEELQRLLNPTELPASPKQREEMETAAYSETFDTATTAEEANDNNI